MIIDDEYIISCFHLKSGAKLVNDLFIEKKYLSELEKPSHFNFYQVDGSTKQMKLFMRKKGKDDEGEDIIIERLVYIISLDGLEYIETREIEDIPEELLKIIDINVEEE